MSASGREQASAVAMGTLICDHISMPRTHETGLPVDMRLLLLAAFPFVASAHHSRAELADEIMRLQIW